MGHTWLSQHLKNADVRLQSLRLEACSMLPGRFSELLQSSQDTLQELCLNRISSRVTGTWKQEFKELGTNFHL